MAENKISYKRWCGGIGDSLKEGSNQQIPNQYYFGRSINHRDDPQALSLLPASLLESGSVVTGLLKDIDIIPQTLDSYSYDINGNLYLRTAAGSWSALRTVANSHGNGIGYFTGDDNLYYASDSTLGMYGPISGSPQFTDNFIISKGGARQNTYSASLVAASSQYAYHADAVSLSITGDLTMECYIKPTSLPTIGNSMILMSKWRSGNNTRSYKFDIAGISAVFGSAIDGNLTVSSNTTDAPIDSACTGTSGSNSLSATNASFASGQEILIHQSQGTNAGSYMRNKIVSYTAGTITLDQALNMSYTTGAQVLVLKQYGNVTVNSGKTWTAKDWNGTTGGILAFLCNGILTINGIISAKGTDKTGSVQPPPVGAVGGGFRGGAAVEGSTGAYSGEGTTGVSLVTSSANGNGGGGGGVDLSYGNRGGGGGGNGSAGISGQNSGGLGGNTSSSNDLTSLTFGGGGGGGRGTVGTDQGAGGSGGGIIFILGATINITGSINVNGGAGQSNGGSDQSCDGGGGAGGSVLLKCQTATLGSGLITAIGGAGGGEGGGAGGNGRIHIDYYNSYTGSTTPTINANQDNNLSTNTTYQLRLWISSNGTVQETLARTCDLTLNSWKHLAVTWTAASHSAEFFLNGNSLGTSSGSYTSISDNTSAFAIGSQDTDLGSYFNGQIDECRLWNIVRTVDEIYSYKDVQISASTVGLVGYWQLNNDWADQTASNNTLTAVNTPTFTTDTPFLSPTTRLDIDLSQTASGQTYDVPIAISETIANKVSFIPNKDPLKSISVKIDTKGTGNWTLTLHDENNNEIASKTEYNSTASLLLQSYSESNQSYDYPLTESSVGESFFNVNQITLNYCKFYLKQKVHAYPEPVVTPTGNCYAKVYALNGNVGVDSVPVGDPLAISEPIDVSTLTTSYTLTTFTFIGANKITLEKNTNYFIVIYYEGTPGQLDAGVYVGSDNTSPTYSGNAAYLGRNWYPDTSYCLCFYVYGNYTNTLNTGDFEFIFSTAVRPLLNATYHFHITSTVADGKVVTNTTADLSTVQYYTYFQILVTDTMYHPIIQFQWQPLGGTLTGAMIIGNERYLAVWDGSSYDPNFITLMTGWKVRCFAQWRNYLAIGVWKGDSITDYHQGRIYFWTGYQPAYDFYIDIPDGQINAMHGVDSDLYIFAGWRGNLIDYKGGEYYNTGNSSSNKLKRMPLLEPECYTEVYPKAINMWRGLLHFGLYADTDSVSSQKGVYSYGTLNEWYPNSLSYDYPISTGSRGSTVKIGMVYPIGQNLLIGWQDGLACGCDVVSFSNPPASEGEVQMYLNDGGTVWKYENNTMFRVDHDTLKTGESITPQISIDRVGKTPTFTQLEPSETVGDIAKSQSIPNGRLNEIQIGAVLRQTNGTSPVLKALTIAQDPLESEQQL